MWWWVVITACPLVVFTLLMVPSPALWVFLIVQLACVGIALLYIRKLKGLDMRG